MVAFMAGGGWVVVVPSLEGRRPRAPNDCPTKCLYHKVSLRKNGLQNTKWRMTGPPSICLPAA